MENQAASNPARERNGLSFRLMKLADVPQVLHIDQVSFSLPWPEKSYIFELTQNPSTLALVAELSPDGAAPVIIGMAVVWVILDEAHIATIAIHPDYRQAGYGKRLLAETLRQSIQRGASLATLEARAGNLAAQKMYAAFGFRVAGHRPQYYHDNNEDAVIMTLEPLGAEYLRWLEKQGY